MSSIFRDLEDKENIRLLNQLPKKKAANLKRQLTQLWKNLNRIKYMMSLPDIVVIINQLKEFTVIQECITLGIL
jgi:ribosomal protein S2